MNGIEGQQRNRIRKKHNESRGKSKLDEIKIGREKDELTGKF